MTMLPDGRLLVLTEHYKNPDGTYKGWLIDKGRFAALSYARSKGFKPTDLAVLHNDVLLLERRYSLFTGTSVRLRRIAGSTLRAGAKLQGNQMLQLEGPFKVDNFEGLAVHQTPTLGALIYLISDDNYSPLQSTLLLQFRLDESASK